MILSVKHRGVLFEVDLDNNMHECPYARLATMFSIPVQRLKLIQKGKMLPPAGAPELVDALRPGVAVQLVGSRREQQLHEPNTVERAGLALREYAGAAAHWARGLGGPRQLLLTLFGLLAATIRVVALFLQSLVMPVRRPRPAGEAEAL